MSIIEDTWSPESCHHYDDQCLI